jgi:hypothetical protein
MNDTMAAVVFMEHRLRSADVNREGWTVDASGETRRERLAAVLGALVQWLVPAGTGQPIRTPRVTRLAAHA